MTIFDICASLHTVVDNISQYETFNYVFSVSCLDDVAKLRKYLYKKTGHQGGIYEIWYKEELIYRGKSFNDIVNRINFHLSNQMFGPPNRYIKAKGRFRLSRTACKVFEQYIGKPLTFIGYVFPPELAMSIEYILSSRNKSLVEKEKHVRS